jgi:Ycf66 protein N-terminus
MLAYLLALTVGLGSLGLYLAAFLFPEIHRKYDLLWSGVGLFYGLVLWVCGDRITGGLLLGQMAGVSLLGWFGWQVMQMRWEQMPLEQRNQLPNSAASLSEVLRERAQQVQVNLRNSEWRSSSLNQLNRLAEKSVEILIAMFDWGTALVGTTVKSWDKPMPTGADLLEPEEPINRDHS